MQRCFFLFCLFYLSLWSLICFFVLSDFSVRFAPQGHRPKRFRIVPDRRGQLLDHSYIGCAIDFFFFFFCINRRVHMNSNMNCFRVRRGCISTRKSFMTAPRIVHLSVMVDSSLRWIIDISSPGLFTVDINTQEIWASYLTSLNDLLRC